MPLRRVLLAIVCLVPATQLQAAVVFSFNYNDDAGTGFNAEPMNPTGLGAQRKAALQTAANNFATAFASYNATIVMDATGAATGMTLAGAGTNFVQAPGFGNGEVVRQKILSGNDLNGSGNADGTLDVNFAYAWQLDFNVAPVQGSTYDWYSTMYHELAHAVGFASFVNTDGMGMNPTDADGQAPADTWGKFDQFLTDSMGLSLFTGDNLNANYTALLTGGSNGLFFDGTNAKMANVANGNNANDGRVGIYSPMDFSEGSSGSHLDDDNMAYNGMMMRAATGDGPSARTFSNVELGVLRDIGYLNVTQITAVPEASAFLFVGLVGLMVAVGKSFMAVRRNAANTSGA